jgi:flagellar basal body-associated protein FliL
MSKNWIRLMIITAAVIVLAAVAYAIYLLIMSDTRVKRKMDSTGGNTSSAMTYQAHPAGRSTAYLNIP